MMLALKMDFDYLSHFDRDESWGEPEKMSPLIFSAVDIIRHMADWPLMVHCGTQGKHKENSKHYDGMAIDGHFITDVALYFQATTIMRILKQTGLDQKMGIGLYPNWNSPGFHFDCRTSPARWGKIGPNYVSWSSVINYAQNTCSTFAW